ncbi:MAG: hypothetical protein ACRDCT_04760 [Shewanella sp.]
MSKILVDFLLTNYAQTNLSAWDTLRVLLSECALQQFQAKGFEVDCGDIRSHYWVQLDDCWLDCGRTNAYNADIIRVTDDDVRRAKIIGLQECALLSSAQINLLCMQNAHFDHC